MRHTNADLHEVHLPVAVEMPRVVYYRSSCSHPPLQHPSALRPKPYFNATICVSLAHDQRTNTERSYRPMFCELCVNVHVKITSVSATHPFADTPHTLPQPLSPTHNYSTIELQYNSDVCSLNPDQCMLFGDAPCVDHSHLLHHAESTNSHTFFPATLHPPKWPHNHFVAYKSTTLLLLIR